MTVIGIAFIIVYLTFLMVAVAISDLRDRVKKLEEK